MITVTAVVLMDAVVWWFGVLFVQECDAALLRTLGRLRPWRWMTLGLIRLNLGCICYLCSAQSFLRGVSVPWVFDSHLNFPGTMTAGPEFEIV